MGYVDDYYNELIAELIPVAAVVADEAIRIYAWDREEIRSAKWNEVYHSTIDRLATERGIRRQVWQATN